MEPQSFVTYRQCSRTGWSISVKEWNLLALEYKSFNHSNTSDTVFHQRGLIHRISHIRVACFVRYCGERGSFIAWETYILGREGIFWCIDETWRYPSFKSVPRAVHVWSVKYKGCAFKYRLLECFWIYFRLICVDWTISVQLTQKRTGIDIAQRLAWTIRGENANGTIMILQNSLIFLQLVQKGRPRINWSILYDTKPKHFGKQAGNNEWW